MRPGSVGQPLSLFLLSLSGFAALVFLFRPRTALAAELEPGELVTPANASEVAGLVSPGNCCSSSRGCK